MRVNLGSGFVSDLMRDLMHGNIMPAAFQRPYVWSKSDVLALCDSIMLGIPIGSFLIWQPRSDFDLSTLERPRLGPVVATAVDQHRRPRSLLLDGQNRLATIAWISQSGNVSDCSLEHLTDHEKQVWGNGETLVLDFSSRSIIFVPTDEAYLGLRLPASALTIGTAGSMSLIRKHWDKEWASHSESERYEFLEWHETISRRFDSARMATTILEDATPEEAKVAFLRMCNVGVPMAAEDFNFAMNWAVSKNK